MKNTYTNADQTVLNIALPILKDYKAQIFAKRAHGKYAIDNALTEGAREVIGRPQLPQSPRRLRVQRSTDARIGSPQNPTTRREASPTPRNLI